MNMIDNIKISYHNNGVVVTLAIEDANPNIVVNELKDLCDED